MSQYVHKGDKVQLTAIFMKSLNNTNTEAYQAVEQNNLLIGTVADVSDNYISIAFGDFGRLDILADDETMPYLVQILKTSDGRTISPPEVSVGDRKMLELSFSVEIVIAEDAETVVSAEPQEVEEPDKPVTDFGQSLPALKDLFGFGAYPEPTPGFLHPVKTKSASNFDLSKAGTFQTKLNTAKWIIEHMTSIQRFIMMQDLARRADADAPYPLFIDHPMTSNEKEFRALRYEMSAVEEQTYNTALNVLRNYMLGQALDSTAGLKRPAHPEILENDEELQ